MQLMKPTSERKIQSREEEKRVGTEKKCREEDLLKPLNPKHLLTQFVHMSEFSRRVRGLEFSGSTDLFFCTNIIQKQRFPYYIFRSK